MDSAYSDALEQIAQSVFATMLDMETFRTDRVACFEPGSVLSTVHIHGAFNGDVSLEFDPDMARASAAAMFRLHQEEVTLEDMHDMATELANMIGGNFKSLVPGPSSLSLPRVLQNQAGDAEPVAERVVLASEAGFFEIDLRVLETA